MTETPESRTEPAAVATFPRWDRRTMLNQVAAWVGIVAGVVFIVAVVFFSGSIRASTTAAVTATATGAGCNYPGGMMGQWHYLPRV